MHAIYPYIDESELLSSNSATNVILEWPGVLDPKHDNIAALATKLVEGGGVHEEDYYLAQGLPSDSLVLDAGANCGQTAIALNSVNPRLRIVSFEPNVYAFRVLEQVADHWRNITVHNCGLSTGKRAVDLHIPVIDGLLITPLASINHEAFLDGAMQSWLEKMAGGQTIHLFRMAIQLQTGDHFQLEPAFIKIDVESHEVECLRGLEGTIRKCLPVLMIEKSQPFEISELLRSWDYGVYRFSKEGRILSRLDVTADTPNSSLPLNLIGLPESRRASLYEQLGVRS